VVGCWCSEKSTAGWLLVAGLFLEKSTAGSWLIRQMNKPLTGTEIGKYNLFHNGGRWSLCSALTSPLCHASARAMPEVVASRGSLWPPVQPHVPQQQMTHRAQAHQNAGDGRQRIPVTPVCRDLCQQAIALHSLCEWKQEHPHKEVENPCAYLHAPRGRAHMSLAVSPSKYYGGVVSHAPLPLLVLGGVLPRWQNQHQH
jgi:hypothetical protein